MPATAAEAVSAAATAVRAVLAQRIRQDVPLPLLDLLQRVAPSYTAPAHLVPLAALFEASRTTPVRAVVSMPPRHGKTETALAALVWRLVCAPTHTVGYVAYGAGLARSKSRRARLFAERAGLTLADDLTSLAEWRTAEGGGFLATGVGGPLTGQGVDLLVIDDPVKNRLEAESALLRERVWDWFQDVAYTRLEPGGSVLVIMTRWHPDDLAGRLLAQGWTELRLPALDDDGEALWPERWPAPVLRQTEQQVGPYTWASLYQGTPRPRGGQVFRDTVFYDTLPAEGYRVAIGVDFAYTTRTHADYSVGILARAVGETLYLEDVIRLQVEAPQFAGVLQRWQATQRAMIWTIIGGTERGIVDFLARDYGLIIAASPATVDKFQRAQPVAAAWNAGRVLVPRDAPWLDAFLNEVLAFTGVADRHDDQVDALAALWQGLTDEASELVVTDDPVLISPF